MCACGVHQSVRMRVGQARKRGSPAAEQQTVIQHAVQNGSTRSHSGRTAAARVQSHQTLDVRIPLPTLPPAFS